MSEVWGRDQPKTLNEIGIAIILQIKKGFLLFTTQTGLHVI